MTVQTFPNIASMFGINEDELVNQALVSFLQEKKREVLQTKLEMLARYGVDSVAALESKIIEGIVREHPTWEDLIVIENLTDRVEELEETLADLQATSRSG